MRIGKHLTSKELLLFHDDESGPKAAEAIEGHLASCEQCRIALTVLKSTTERLHELYRYDRGEDQLKQQYWQMRSRLMSHLRQATEARGFRIHSHVVWRFVYAATGLIGVSLMAYRMYSHVDPGKAMAYVQQRGLPNPKLTPGDVTPVSFSDVCPAKDDDQDPPVPAPIQKVVFDEYGVSNEAQQDQFQVDYLINPQLGGTSSVQNLWPQPYRSTVWNAYAKDALEDRLHSMVCQHKIELSVAQREIAKDWIQAYKKYFLTDIPISDEAMLSDEE